MKIIPKSITNLLLSATLSLSIISLAVCNEKNLDKNKQNFSISKINIFMILRTEYRGYYQAISKNCKTIC